MKIDLSVTLRNLDDTPMMESFVKKDEYGKVIPKRDSSNNILRSRTPDGTVFDVPETDEKPLTLGQLCLSALAFVKYKENGYPDEVLTSKEQQTTYFLAFQIMGALKKNKGVADLSIKDDISILKEKITKAFNDKPMLAGQALMIFDKAEQAEQAEKMQAPQKGKKVQETSESAEE